MQLRIEDFDLIVTLDVGSGHLAGTLGVDLNDLGTGIEKLGNKTFHIEHNLRDVFLDARNS